MSVDYDEGGHRVPRVELWIGSRYLNMVLPAHSFSTYVM